MFRINNKNNSSNLIGNRTPASKLFSKLKANKKITGGILALLFVFLGYVVWTHGNPFSYLSDEELIATQLQSPLPPEWQQKYFGRQICRRENYCGPEADPDNDNLSNYEEFLYFTDPSNPDTDTDGFLDGEEVRSLTNPIGTVSGNSGARDVLNVYEYNPVIDEIIQAGLDEMEEGSILSLDQIAVAASQLTTLPDFKEIPFKITNDNTQESVNKYLDNFVRLVTDYKDKSISNISIAIADTTDIGKINEYIEATEIHATSFVFIDVPSDLFNFHKDYYASIVFSSLMAIAQRDYLEGKITETQVQDKIRTYSIYYTRFLQEVSSDITTIQKKYDFLISLSE